MSGPQSSDRDNRRKLTSAAGWEWYSRRKPEFAVLTDGRTGGDFIASGEHEVAQRLDFIRSRGYKPSGTALDIGCGLGRLSAALARHFKTVIAVDHSPTMLRLAETRLAELGITNVQLVLSEGDRFAEVATSAVDFAFSRYVFQHMPTWSMIVSNLQEVTRVLSRDGLAWLHFDTRPQTLAYRLWNWLEPHLPRGMGPETRRAPIRRYRRAASALQDAFTSTGLQVFEEVCPSSDGHEYLLGHRQPIGF